MDYSQATIKAAHVDGGEEHTIDLEGMTLSDLCANLAELIPPRTDEEREEEELRDPEAIPAHVRTFDPDGFAVHLFEQPSQSRNSNHVDPVAAFNELSAAWSDESDNDRREAMGDYMDNGSADDLSAFDEAYQGQYSSGADFAEQFADDVGAVDERNARWICIDWEATWERNLRHDYWVSDNGHVFRNL